MTTQVKSGNDPVKGKQHTAGIPVAALKRFAIDLESDQPTNKFLQINRERVDEFINNRPEDHRTKTPIVKPKRSYQTPGVFDYGKAIDGSSDMLIQLQSLAEFHPSLGTRSRFGDGDGSFFDQWLNSDVAKSKHLFDKDGFPIMRFQGQLQSGFKKHLNDHKSGKHKTTTPPAIFVQSYAQRRAERLKREKEKILNPPQEAANSIESPPKLETLSLNLPPLSRVNTASSIATEGSVGAYSDNFTHVNVPQLSDPLKLPALTTLSPSDRASYFGENARISFFEDYRQLARMRNTIALQGDEDEELGVLLTARTHQIEQFQFSNDAYELIEDSGGIDLDEFSEDTGSESEHMLRTTYSKHSSRKAMILEDGNTDCFSSIPPLLGPSPAISRQNTARSGNNSHNNSSSDNNNTTTNAISLYIDEENNRYSSSQPTTARSNRSLYTMGTGTGGRSRNPSRGRTVASFPSAATSRRSSPNKALRSIYSRQRLDESYNQITEEEKQKLLDTLQTETSDLETNNNRPLSARTKFLIGCIRKGILPQASLIIRKNNTTTLSLASFGIGNNLAIILAESIKSLPLLEGLNISDNNLTDQGLVPLIKSISINKKLFYLNISRNKVDVETAKALLLFISSAECNLTHLIMANANVDDREAAKFVKVIATRQGFKELDLSQNELGSHEFALKQKETAGLALGSLLSDPRCTLERLNLSWNMLRYQSGSNLVKSLKVNTSLTYLDLSYNRLCADGGDILGNALHSNRTLRILKLAHNNITSRPCCTILSGVVSCKTLVEVDLSKNPIGELGARLLLAIDLKYGDRVKVDIFNCHIRVHDSSCWFDPIKPKKEYILHLNEPYERCVCIELLRQVAVPGSELTIESYQYSTPEDTVMRDMELMLYNPNPISDETNISPREIERKVEEVRNMYKETANRIFRQYDTDNSGGLDRYELANILDQMGMEGSTMMVNQLMSIYDTDSSGLVEEEEFIAFLMDIKSTSVDSIDAKPGDRFLYLQEENSNYNSSSGGSSSKDRPTPYFPPEIGTVHIKLKTDIAKEISPQHISRRSVETMLDATKSSEDRSAIFDYALSVMKLQFPDAQTFYRVMLKEIGNTLSVLTRLIPRMSTPHDARLLITYVTGNDFEQLLLLRQTLGRLYSIYTGLPNGFYKLNLSEPTDQICLKALIELNNSSIVYRKRVGLGDTSQDGNWMSFRNTVYEGNHIILTYEWLNNLPEKGKFEFDFIHINAISMSELEISNFRLFRLMNSLGMIKEDKRRRIFEKLNLDKEESRMISRGTGYRLHTELKAGTMEQASNHLFKLYSNFENNRHSTVETVISEVERSYLRPVTVSKVNTGTGGMNTHPSTPARTPRAVVATGGGSTSKAVVGAAKQHSPLPPVSTTVAASRTKPPQSGQDADSSSVVNSDSHGSFIKDMLESGTMDPALTAERLLETLKFALSGRYLTCIQLALLIERFPDGYLPYGDYGTYRTELIIALHSRILDLINFEYILKDLESSEIAILIFRLGWLNIWNPIKAEGRIILDLSRREERQMVRILLILHYAEPGPSWQEATYRPVRGEPPEEEWVLPVSWYSESSLPTKGIVSFKYFSGMGCNSEDCAPNPASRHTLMALVLAKSYSSDVWSGNKANLDSVEMMISKMGVKLSFITEVQSELADQHNVHSNKD